LAVYHDGISLIAQMGAVACQRRPEGGSASVGLQGLKESYHTSKVVI
jgi:hypothetical protein